MCGLYGYCANPLGHEMLNPQLVHQLVGNGLVYNRHRGTDAWGYVAKYNEGETQVVYRKNGADPLEVIEKNYYPDGVPHTVCAHTRAATRGSTEDNTNNHPVVVGSVLVTHNGTINNHESIKRRYEEQFKQKKIHLPDVDSAAISAMIYTLWPNPEATKGIPPDELLRNLRDLDGGWAVSVSWGGNQNARYTMLIRGRTSPLVLASHDMFGYLWASELDAIWASTEQIEKATEGAITTNDWEVRTMDDSAWLMLDNGFPLQAGKIPPKPVTTTGTLRPTKRRKGRSYFNDAGDNGTVNHWTKDQSFPPSIYCMLGGKFFEAKKKFEDNVRLKNAVFINTPEDYKRLHISVREILSDADMVIGIPADNGGHQSLNTYVSRVYGYYLAGEDVIEVVVAGTGSVKDVFFWKKGDDLEQRWVDIEKEEEEKKPAEGHVSRFSVEEYRDWVIRHTTLAKTFDKPSVRMSRWGGYSSARWSSADESEAIVTSKINGKEVVSIGTRTYFLSDDNDFGILGNRKCTEHKLALHKHAKPQYHCKEFRAAIVQTLRSFQDLTEMSAVFPFEVTIKKSDDESDDFDWFEGSYPAWMECERFPKGHVWTPISRDGLGVVEDEVCTRCESIRFVKKFYFDKANEVSLNYEAKSTEIILVQGQPVTQEEWVKTMERYV